MDNQILDDNAEWFLKKNVEEDLYYTNDASEVVMIRTFNTEEQAYIYAARLKDNDIDAHVIGTTISQMTPFAYGNYRLYVAEAHALKATQLLKEMDALNVVLEQPRLSAVRIFIIIFMGLMIMSIILAAIRVFLYGFTL